MSKDKRKAQDTTRTRPIDSRIKTKWKGPQITRYNEVAAKRDSIANKRLTEAKAKQDSLARKRKATRDSLSKARTSGSRLSPKNRAVRKLSRAIK